MGHHPDPLHEAPQASWVALVVEIGPRLTTSGRALDSIAPDVLPSHQYHCSVVVQHPQNVPDILPLVKPELLLRDL